MVFLICWTTLKVQDVTGNADMRGQQDTSVHVLRDLPYSAGSWSSVAWKR